MQLKRELSRFDLLLLAVGSIIGSGWLFGALYTAQIAGPAAILSWILGGILIFIIALTFAEISTLLLSKNGSVSFTSVSHGRLCGAILSWVTWLWTMCIPVIEVQAVIQYSSNYIPGLFQPSSHSLTVFGFLLAGIIMFAMSLINLMGVKILAKTNKLIVFWKLIIPFIVAFVLIFHKGNVSNLVEFGGFAPYGLEGIFSAISNGGIAMSFFGFQIAIFLAGEAKNPQKTIPYSLFGSLLICMVLYVCLQYGFIVSLSPKDLAQGWNKLSFVGDAGPFAGILVSLGFTYFVKILYFDAILAPLGTGLTQVTVSSRILYSMSLARDVPLVLSKLNRFAVPWLAIVVNFMIGMLFFLPFSGWQEMVSFLSAAIILTLVCGPVCLPIYRKNLPDSQRAFKLPYGKFISFIAFYFCNLIFHWTGWKTIYRLDVAIIIGLCVYLIPRLLDKQLRKSQLHVKSFIWLLVYLILTSIVSYFSEYGGIGKISMRVDFLFVFLITLFVYYLSQKTALNSDEMKKMLKENLIT